MSALLFACIAHVLQVHQAVVLAKDLEVSTEKSAAQDLEYKRLVKEREINNAIRPTHDVGESTM